MGAQPNHSNRSARTGLIGLGLLGSAIAENLIAAGFEPVGFDIDDERCQNLRSLGGRVAGCPAEAADGTDRVVLCLPDSKVVKEVVEGPDGILSAKAPPDYIIDTTTGDPDDTILLADLLESRGVALLDAAVSGSSEQLRRRRAVIIAGGRKETYESCLDLLDALSERVFYMGPSGSGAKAKLASNLVLGLNRLALAEGLVFAEKLGLDVSAFLTVLETTPAYSAVMDTKGRKMLDGDFEPQARLRQHRKDVALVLKQAEAAGQDLPASKLHLQILDSAIASGDGELDNSAVIKELRRKQKE